MKQTGDHRIHAEFASFNNLQTFELFEKYVVRNSDSLGMNEVEVQLLVDYWSGTLTDINQEQENNKSIE
jgi:ADP-dependent phosphofructokinase/glucokinase